MLQWFPTNPDRWIFYNCCVNGQHGSVIRDIITGETIRQFDRPAYCLSSTAALAICLNFARLHRLRPGYGYPGAADPFEDDPCPKLDGLWRLDLSTGLSKLMYSLRELSEIDPQPSMRGAWHYLNHAVFNPSGNRFIVFHVWIMGPRRFIRVFTCGADGSGLFLLTNESMVSHFAWRSDNELLAFSRHEETGLHFHLYEDRTNRREVFASGLLKEDGHPQFSPDGSSLLLDSYPDANGYQHLFLVRLPELTRVELATLPTNPLLRGEFRCDLHPRWDRGGHCVCVDSSHEGKRATYLIKAPPLADRRGVALHNKNHGKNRTALG
jgi:hypothetical protein